MFRISNVAVIAVEPRATVPKSSVNVLPLCVSAPPAPPVFSIVAVA